ncbi:MAG: hypothetical protein DI563_00725 [Variovorax paradoxus]|uniref:Error-prone DNA polymerase n=1 Tax=Variovorax paradoxus TaxID=34073 RepID=A0A2W5QMZ2_VARPD|nr:MAG: hypothetical protein DI563_00725 [Variovorax paradoxus]
MQRSASRCEDQILCNGRRSRRTFRNTVCMYSIIAGDIQVPPPYAELYCRSNFTFLTGASQPEDLVERAAAKMYSALALTDECTVSGVVRGHLAARESGLHFIVGSEILLTTAGGTDFARIVFLAQDRVGYGNLCEVITLARTRAPTLGIPLFQEQVMQIAMLAADFTAGEADQLRRAMGAWRRKGGLAPHQQKLVKRMLAKGYTQDFADRISKQVEGFGSYGFPESHAASFGLLVYVSCWMKRHHPDAMLAGLLNSQPMGFYAPAQLVRDAKEHGVVVRPVDVTVSDWNSTLEEPAQGEVNARWDANFEEPIRAVRLGMSLIVGMREAAAARIVLARSTGPFTGVEDLARRAQLDVHDLRCLSGADALRTLAGHRPNAVWEAVGVETRPTALLKDAPTIEEHAEFGVPTEGAEIADDYASMGLTLRRHPMALLRPQLSRMGIRTAEELRRTAKDRDQVRASGIVTHRQQPSTASGVIFATLEDETGTVNIIVWPSVAAAQRHALRGSMLLSVQGTWQAEKGVYSLVAQKLVNHDKLLGRLRATSRDFR